MEMRWTGRLAVTKACYTHLTLLTLSSTLLRLAGDLRQCSTGITRPFPELASVYNPPRSIIPISKLSCIVRYQIKTGRLENTDASLKDKQVMQVAGVITYRFH